MKQARGFRGRVALPPPARVARPVRQRGVWRCADEPPKRAPRHLEAGAGTARTALARRVLVVDDETSVRMLCRFNLSAAGMEVREAADGDQALEAIREEAPELLLLDVMMPKRDGWKVAE